MTIIRFTTLFAALSFCTAGCAVASENDEHTGTESQDLTCGKLGVNASLVQNQSVKSCDGRFNFALQGDGNMVLYQGAAAIWASNTNYDPVVPSCQGLSGAQAIACRTSKALIPAREGMTASMQGDGNFVIYGDTYIAMA